MGLLIGFGMGAIAGVLLSVAALRQGAVGGDMKLDAGVFVECPCGYCGGRSIKKLSPGTSMLPHNRPGTGKQCKNPSCRFIYCSMFDTDGDSRDRQCRNRGGDQFESVELLYQR